MGMLLGFLGIIVLFIPEDLSDTVENLKTELEDVKLNLKAEEMKVDSYRSYDTFNNPMLSNDIQKIKDEKIKKIEKKRGAELCDEICKSKPPEEQKRIREENQKINDILAKNLVKLKIKVDLPIRELSVKEYIDTSILLKEINRKNAELKGLSYCKLKEEKECSYENKTRPSLTKICSELCILTREP